MSQPQTILIIEDEPTILETLAAKLALEKFTIITGHNGQDGLQKAIDHKPDLILLDLVMPVMDGLTMLKNARREPTLREVPILVLTNLSDEATVQEVMKCHHVDFLLKTDHSLEDIVKKIRTRLQSPTDS